MERSKHDCQRCNAKASIRKFQVVGISDIIQCVFLEVLADEAIDTHNIGEQGKAPVSASMRSV